jgi:hypothetical protein
MKYADSDEVIESKLETMVSSQEMRDLGCDLVTRRKSIRTKKGLRFFQFTRKVNLGHDAKRKLLEDGINTAAFVDLDEAYKERKVVRYLTKTNVRKSVDNVILYRKKSENKSHGSKSLRIQGSYEKTVVRIIVSSMLQQN